MAPQIPKDLLEKMADPSIEFGRILANPDPGEEVVITGISGQYPNSKDVHEFRDNLMNKVDMVSGDSRRWEPGHPEIPQRTGKLPDIAKFDAGFFGVHHRQATASDPMLRILLETVISALFDAGLHPSELEGTDTGVFVGSCFSETEKCWFLDKLIPQGFALTGCQRSMLANRVSYFLKLQGPSFICDTACSSSLYALENAYKAIRMGKCDQAIVAGTNMCLHPFVSLQFARLGVLSMDGCCKAFDKHANGYARSEAISAVLLQRAKASKRIYCTVLHAKTNCDGYKNSGITYPSGEMQVKLLKEFYQECTAVKPSDLSFLEAHGTGTKVGDPEELQAIQEVFLPGRSTPLLIGSVKSNIGHSEPTSGLCSLTKVILAMETGYITPNIHFNEHRPECKALEDGRMKVVTDVTPFNDNRGIIGVNSFGFGGGNCHILLKRHVKNKVKGAKGGIPWLVCVSGRTKEAVEALLDDVIDNRVDVEHVRLLHEIFRFPVPGHVYRGYLLASQTGQEITRSFQFSAAKTPRLILCFGLLRESLKGHIDALADSPLASQSIRRLQQCLTANGPSILEMIKKPAENLLQKTLSHFFLQVILADLIKACGLVPDKVAGVNSRLSLGVLIAAYWDGAVTLKEAVDCAISVAWAANLANSNDCHDLGVLFSTRDAIASQLQENLMGILGKPRRLSGKFMCAAAPREFSAGYLMSSFGALCPLQPTKDHVVFEVGDGSVVSTWCVAGRHIGGTLKDLLTSLGWLHERGFGLHLHNIYPLVEFPVSRGTPMISPKIKWNHRKDWWVTLYRCDDQLELEERSVKVMLNDPGYNFIGGHVIDGRILFPAAGYLQLVWETLAHVHGLMIVDTKVVFERCKFVRACSVQENHKLELAVMIQRGTGQFEVVESGVPVVTGVIRRVPDEEMALIPLPSGVPMHAALHLGPKDVYKELRLRGYDYKDNFRRIKSCDSSVQVAEINWDGNWITFIDNMLQLKILREDTRLLYVPTGIDRLFIDSKRHMQFVKNLGTDNPDVPVYLSLETGIVKSGGIEIRGLKASSVPRRKYLAVPVLEKYVFVPNEGRLNTEQAVRVDVQILLENLLLVRVKAVELVDEATPRGSTPLGGNIFEALSDQPLIKPEIVVLSKEPLEVTGATVEDKKLFTETDCDLVVASKLLQRPNVLGMALGAIKENGFILSREPLGGDLCGFNSGMLSLVTLFVTAQERLVLFRKKGKVQQSKLVRVSAEGFAWLRELQEGMSQGEPVLAYAQGEPLSGILGLVACLRREPGGRNVKLAFLPDTLKNFDVSARFFMEQLDKDLAVNVLRDGRWGTYRHLLLENAGDAPLVEHCYLNSLVRGDLSSLTWVEGPLLWNSTVEPDRVLVSVYYASLNFRDLMTASGRISVDSITRDRREQECVQGLEFSGRTQRGKRVFGIVTKGALASLMDVEAESLIEVPDSVTLEEAATIPVVYGTAFFALFKRGKMKSGDSVLIHSGTGGVGQAAIALALYVGCTVYTTVGTKEKREFLKRRFPQLTDEHISNSRDTHFEEVIMRATRGKGVDLVLNSLAEEKLSASVRCLAPGGRFLEIGKFDLANDNRLRALLLAKGASFHGVMLDSLFQGNFRVKLEVLDFLKKGILSGAVRPLNRTVFAMDRAEDAFRYMSTGQHTGKVLIRIRQEEAERVVPISKRLFPAQPRYTCDHNKTYVICGGLGGFGLELADWLVLRGCRKLVLTSRTGLKAGYQGYRIAIWKSYGCLVQVSTADITTYMGCMELLTTANGFGPVHGVFNLAVVLKDALLTNQTADSFKASLEPKAIATELLDRASREVCPDLRDFVVFSSVSCGRGNAGQSNYGMANSVMERICEQRRSDGLPGLAIEWGAIGDVGLVAELQNDSVEREIGGTLQQRISNCLQVLDVLLKQNKSAVVSSMVVAEKRGIASGTDNMVDAVARILGVKDLKAISLQATLAEVGMDSMTAVEIKQTLEREYDVFLTAPDIKTMTFAKLIEIQAERDEEASDSAVKKDKALRGMDMILRYMGDESTANLPVLPISGRNNARGPTLVIFPGVEGVVTVLEPLYRNLEARLVGLQYPNDTQKGSIPEMAASYLPLVESQLDSKTFILLSYSFGGLVALEMAALLEERGYEGTVVCIDSAPDYLKGLTEMLEVESDDKFQVSLLVHLMSMQVSYEVISKHVEGLLKLNTLEERIRLAQTIVGKNAVYSPEYQRAVAVSLYKRLKAVVEWEPDLKLRSKVALFKPSLTSIELPEEDYGLSKYCLNPVEVRVFEGNHASILENLELAEVINERYGTSRRYEDEGAKEDRLVIDIGRRPEEEVHTKL